MLKRRRFMHRKWHTLQNRKHKIKHFKYEISIWLHILLDEHYKIIVFLAVVRSASIIFIESV